MEEITAEIDGAESFTLRVRQLNGRWIASADTDEGPSLGLSLDRLAAIYLALDPLQPDIEPVLDGIVPVEGEAETT